MQCLLPTPSQCAMGPESTALPNAARTWLSAARKTVVLSALNMPLAISCGLFSGILSTAGSPYLGTFAFLIAALWLLLAVTVFVFSGIIYLFVLAFFFASFSLRSLLAFVFAFELGCSLALSPEPEVRIAGLFEMLCMTIATTLWLISRDPRLA